MAEAENKETEETPPEDVDLEHIRVEIVTPSRTAFDGKVCWLQVQAVDGLMEVLPGHASLVTALDVGLAKLCFEGDVQYSVALNGGIMEVAPGQVLILAGSAERPEDIDVEDAREELEDLKERLSRVSGLTREHRLIQEKLWIEARIGAFMSQKEKQRDDAGRES